MALGSIWKKTKHVFKIKNGLEGHWPSVELTLIVFLLNVDLILFYRLFALINAVHVYKVMSDTIYFLILAE